MWVTFGVAFDYLPIVLSDFGVVWVVVVDVMLVVLVLSAV